MHENEAISIKTRLKAPVLARITSIFEISAPELIKVMHCHKFPPRVTIPPPKKPADVTVDNEKQVWHTLYDDHDEVKHVQYKFNIGDQVRISKIKRTFEKGYLPNFSKEIFTVSKQIPRDPPVYRLKDYDGEELKGTFYEKELQNVIKPDDVYEVEKILKKRGRGRNVQYLVKWLGYPNKFNSWVSASEINSIS